MVKFKGESTDLTPEAADLLKKADDGDGEAQYYFAQYLLCEPDHSYRKDITPEQIERALYYLKQSAMTGCIQGAAALELADLYFNGKLIPQDYKKAHMWYSTAQMSRNPVADCSLGDYALNGYDCDVDYEKAAKLYLKAAPRFLDAFYRLGDMFANGQFFNRDLVFARKIYEYVIKREDAFYAKQSFYSQAHEQAIQRLEKLEQMEKACDMQNTNENDESAEQLAIKQKILELIEDD